MKIRRTLVLLGNSGNMYLYESESKRPRYSTESGAPLTPHKRCGVNTTYPMPGGLIKKKKKLGVILNFKGLI